MNRLTRLFPIRAGLLGAVLILACSEQATGPEGPQLRTVGAEEPTSLMVCKKLPYESTSAWIGPTGGKLKAGPNVLYVPAGALSERTLLTVTSPSGSINRVILAPSWLSFNPDYPARLVMSYQHCSGGGTAEQRIVNVDDHLDIKEVMPSLNDPIDRTVEGKVIRFFADVLFSTYAVAY